MVVSAISTPAAHAADSCPNAAFRTGAGAKLPDCRAYEQVSPVDKGGVPVSGVYPVIASEDGSQSVFASTGSLGGDNSVFAFNPYRATRGSAWSTDALSVPQGSLPRAATGGPVAALSEDFAHEVVLSRRALTSDATEGAGNIYVHEIGTADYRLVASASGAGSDSVFSAQLQSVNGLVYGGSPDFSTVVFSTVEALTGDAVNDGDANTYRWDSGVLRLIGKTTGSFPLGTTNPDRHRVTSSGRVTYPAATSPSQNDLFQDTPGAQRKLISRSHRTGDNAATPQGISGTFFNSPDGASVTFTSSKPLVDGEVPTAAGTYNTIHRWNAADDSLVDLLAGKVQTDSQKEIGPSVFGVSDDGDYVYFTSTAVFTPGAIVNQANNYVLHVPDGRLSLISPVTVPAINQARLSPDGSRLVFATDAAINGYDSGGTLQVWSYDAATPDTPPTCVSCPPAGTTPTANARLGYDPGGFNSAASHPVTDDGRVFFDTGQKLTTGDGNGTFDVYEYLPGGERRLISAGGAGGDATLGDVTPDGNSVFFATAAGLVPQDVDGTRDVYVARVGGGLAAQQVAPSSVAPCAGSECQGAAPLPRPRPVPGSSTLIPYTPPPATTFTAGRPSSSALRGLARSGRLKLRVRVGGPGTVRVRARAKVGRKTVTVASASARARRAGTVTLTLTLSKAARRELARDRRLRIAATVAFSQAAKDSTLRFTITQARSGSSSKGGDR